MRPASRRSGSAPRFSVAPAKRGKRDSMPVLRSSPRSRPAVSPQPALRREVAVTPEMPVAEAEQVSAGADGAAGSRPVPITVARLLVCADCGSGHEPRSRYAACRTFRSPWALAWLLAGPRPSCPCSPGKPGDGCGSHPGGRQVPREARWSESRLSIPRRAQVLSPRTAILNQGEDHRWTPSCALRPRWYSSTATSTPKSSSGMRRAAPPAPRSRVRDERRQHRRTKPYQPVLVLASLFREVLEPFHRQGGRSSRHRESRAGRAPQRSCGDLIEASPHGTLCLLDVGIREPHNP
jgi:hypothetical protein